jgi:hypothetical protein
MTQENGELITSARAAIILGKSVATIRRKAEAGDLEYVQKLPPPNGAFLFRLAYIEQLAGEAAEAAAQATA